MDNIICYDSYTGKKFVISKERVELIRKEIMDFNKQVKEHCIKNQLNKPFLQQLYEMFGRGLVTYRSSNLFAIITAPLIER